MLCDDNHLHVSSFLCSKWHITVKSDETGLCEFNSFIYSNEGILDFKNKIENKKKPFYVINQKTSISSKKLAYFEEKNINLLINSYKKIDELYFSVYSSNQWIYTKKIRLNNKKANFDFTVNDKFSGFLDFIIHRNYSYGDDISSLKVFVGNKKDLDKKLLTLKNKYVDNIISTNKANKLFYDFIISQLESEQKDPPLVFDSFKLQEKRINYYKKKYTKILWYVLIALAILILILVFIYGNNHIKKANEAMDYDFISKGKYLYLYFILVLIAVFFFMIFFVLRLV